MQHRQSGALHLVGIFFVLILLGVIFGSAPAHKPKNGVPPPTQSQQGPTGATQSGDKSFEDYCLALAKNAVKSQTCEDYFARRMPPGAGQ